MKTMQQCLQAALLTEIITATASYLAELTAGQLESTLTPRDEAVAKVVTKINHEESSWVARGFYHFYKAIHPETTLTEDYAMESTAKSVIIPPMVLFIRMNPGYPELFPDNVPILSLHGRYRYIFGIEGNEFALNPVEKFNEDFFLCTSEQAMDYVRNLTPRQLRVLTTSSHFETVREHATTMFLEQEPETSAQAVIEDAAVASAQ